MADPGLERVFLDSARFTLDPVRLFQHREQFVDQRGYLVEVVSFSEDGKCHLLAQLAQGVLAPLPVGILDEGLP